MTKMKYRCTWPWTTLVILSDGKVVCGCGDPYAQKILGDSNKESIHDIWNGEKITRLRNQISIDGYSEFCEGCPLKDFLKEGELPVDNGKPPPYPSRLFIEPSSLCNLSCYKACCGKSSEILLHRNSHFLDFSHFREIIDETGKHLIRIDLFNYGETFLNKNAVGMCSYIKDEYPSIYLFSSTNGLAFTEQSMIKLIDSGIDEITFSIDGATQESYGKYRIGGSIEKALSNLSFLVSRRNEKNLRLPYISWRYILFNWNDSDDEMQKAVKIAKKIGVDRLTWEITDHPEDAFSRKYAPGTDSYKSIKFETWDKGLGNAIPGYTPKAEIRLTGINRFLPVVLSKNRPKELAVSVRNISETPFYNEAPLGRRFVRLGIQLYSKKMELLDLNFARAYLNKSIMPGEKDTIDIKIPPIERQGLFTFKFDLVMEGVDWFEKSGSHVLWKNALVT